MKILMVAAENDALPNGKVGGIGDVIRDVPIALSNEGQNVDVVVPCYGTFSTLANAKKITEVNVSFYGQHHTLTVYKISSSDNIHNNNTKINQWVIEHQNFAIGGNGQIYCNDPDHQPFATDATKFALFSCAVAKAIIDNVFGEIDVIHLHDWHTSTIAVLRAYDPMYQALQSIKTVYTIHNLALQGIRPFAEDHSSFKAWFPELHIDSELIHDPRYPHCFNPMRAGITLCDKVHAVSPNYAEEIQSPSNRASGFVGGEGLENDLLSASQNGRLHGILNGCEYQQVSNNTQQAEQTEQVSKTTYDLNTLLPVIKQQLLAWIANKPLTDEAHLVALTRISQLLEGAPQQEETSLQESQTPLVLTSVGRITNQKVQLFKQPIKQNSTALEQLLKTLGDKGVFIMLGSGDSKLETFLLNVAKAHPNFIFIKGYSESLSDTLYHAGDLFMMPSSFEPCGISQMLAMRAGQPCFVHNVGGLKDTVTDGHNGYSFAGQTPEEQAHNMLSRFETIVTQIKDKTQQWDTIVDNALATRFRWQDVAKNYLTFLY